MSDETGRNAASAAVPGAASSIWPDEAIEWLARAEIKAGALYAKAGICFSGDPLLLKLLRELSEDEGAHLDMLVNAGRHIKSSSPPPVDLSGIGTFTRIAAAFEERLAAGNIDEAALMEMIVELEFSEHNELFAYIVNALRGFPVEFSDLIDAMNAHRLRIREHLAARAEFKALLIRIDALPSYTKKHNILVVDDESTITSLLRIILAGEGSIDWVGSGRAALDAIGKKDYSLIVSDVRMPEMEGREFYRECSRRHPCLKERFLFLTGTVDWELIEFFRTSSAEYLIKPVSVRTLREKISAMLETLDRCPCRK